MICADFLTCIKNTQSIYKPAQYKCNKVTMLHHIIVSSYTNSKYYLVAYVI